LNIVQLKIFQLAEEIKTKANSTLTHLHLMQIFDLVFSNKWFSLADKDPRDLINCANFIMDLQIVFKGTYLADKVAEHSKMILMDILGLGST
jgi:hypothetical protein